MINNKFIKKGRYGGKLCEFTHYNPINGQVWSDDIETNESYIDDRTKKQKNRKVLGKWVNNEKVKWEDK